MIRRPIGWFVAVVLTLGTTAVAQHAGTLPAGTQETSDTVALPLTTKSPQARHIVEEAMNLYLDKVEQANSIELLRAGLKIDPEFAMGHEFLAWVSLDPAEQVREQAGAFANRTHASTPEQLVIEWCQDSADHNLISAITKMNEVLAQYPHDKWVVWMATWWLTQETQYERSIDIYEHSGLTDNPGLMNNAGYNYAYIRQFDKAFALMDKYVAALPKDANPQDSYAEILRMAGRYDRAVEHYRASLAIDPEFYSSQFGIADTYSLMGDQVRARREYLTGFQKFSLPELHRILWQTREATTYVREGDYDGADKAFQAVADYGHAHQMSQVEADVYRQMALYQPDAKRALGLLDQADRALQGGANAQPAAIQQEQAQLLRARVELALKLDDKSVALSAMMKLGEMSQKSNDKLIETAYEGAAGAAAFSDHQYKIAIPHLQEDTDNPLSLKLLAEAYEKTKDHVSAKRTLEVLADFSDPTLEQALVVPPFRKCFQDRACSAKMALK
jgi:tetratricopeptide (TPR) repeat protein